MSNYKEQMTEKEIKEILEIFLVHHKLINKVPEKDLGFMKRKVFINHKNRVNSIYEEFKQK